MNAARIITAVMVFMLLGRNARNGLGCWAESGLQGRCSVGATHKERAHQPICLQVGNDEDVCDTPM